MKGIWVTWELQRRNIGLSAAIGFPLYQISIQSNRVIRYLKSIIATYRAIRSESPNIVVAQNPSIVLALFVILYSKIGRYRPVIDAHNSGIYPLEGRSTLLWKLSCWLQRRAALTIVTNQTLKDVVESNGGKAFILPDAVPNKLSNMTGTKLKGEKNLTCICTFSADEPYLEILKAASSLPNNIHVYFTGKFVGKIDPKNLADNVHLTGFISEVDYWNLLYSSDIIIDLTLRENCLVCGAYEAIALGKPLILSNTVATKKYFSKGCIYVDPFKDAICMAMQESLNNIESLRIEIQVLKMEIHDTWIELVSQIKDEFNMMAR